VSPKISGWCWAQRNKWQRSLAWRSQLSNLRERERERGRQTIAVGYLVNPIWPPLGGLPHSCDSKAVRDVKHLGCLPASCHLFLVSLGDDRDPLCSVEG
jgi:hypothetical protein